MSVKKIFTVLLLVCLFYVKTYAQDYYSMKQKTIDSLKRELLMAKHDTDKIIYRYKVGLATFVFRTGFWDSIVNEAESHKLTRLKIIALNYLAHSWGLIGESTKQLELNTKGFNLAEKYGYKSILLGHIRSLAYYYLKVKDNNRALEFCYKGLKISEELHDTINIRVYNSIIGTAYFFSGDYKKALNIHLKNLEDARKQKRGDAIATALLNVGTDYAWLKDNDKAAYYYLQSAKYVNEVVDKGMTADIFNSLGSAYQMKQMPDSAYYFYTKALNIYKKVDDYMGLASVMTLLANYHLDQGNLKIAENIANEAFTLVKKVNFISQVPALSDILKKIYIKEGNYKAALEVYELNIKTRDSLSNEKVRKEATEKEYNYNLEKKENENKLLSQENKIQSLEITQNRYFMLGLGVLLVLVFLMAWLFIRQNKFKTQQQSLQLEQKLLRTQMNPHFIFNALNTIQQFIIALDNDKAQLYLSKFSRLMRKLLESNVKDSITLQEETEILEKYLEIESLRFNNVFSYEIRLQPGIDPTQINIPHFLTQPFVENAIWHGLLPKDGDKQLSITFEMPDEKTLSCTIDDNGVGRDNRREETPREEKRSLAIHFIRQRLELINKIRRSKYKLTLTDKKDGEGNNAGLRVNIAMPVLNN